jgi:hypothetical protein
MVAVDTPDRVAMASGVRDIWSNGSGERDEKVAHLARCRHRVKGQ